MKQKNLTGLFTFRNNGFPDWFSYSIDSSGKNIPVNKNGKVTMWNLSNNIFYFTDEQEKEIEENIKKFGYCIFKSSVAVIFSEWQPSSSEAINKKY